ncbi:hypothetical protein HCA63_06910 [Listeria booriae]|uniref:hypothetical protein n=1 Tax=Listeria booriae TaxID=1552123 RepID=UPI00162A1753|nr:hypothetical protein [Listeria booriae]MBC1888079.1 hypothetical protein [Listeria booriae]
MQNFENGGAVAIKGFNFQKAAITFIAIKNLNKSGFHILVESKDDFEVKYDGYSAYIQVKSQKLSLNKLLSSTKGKSILEKNLSNGDNNSKFKIFVKSFSEGDLKKMNKVNDGHICAPLYSYSNSQKDTIVEKLKESEIKDHFEEKLSQSYIYVPPFKDVLSEAVIFLLGEMAENDIAVSNKRGHIAINELFTLIDQKSEFIITSEADYSKKEILKKDLHEIFKLTSTLDDFDRLLESTTYNFFEKRRIRMEQVKIIYSYGNEKNMVKQQLENFDVFSEPNEEAVINEAIKFCDGIYSFTRLTEHAKIAIIIEILSEMGKEI